MARKCQEKPEPKSDSGNDAWPLNCGDIKALATDKVYKRGDKLLEEGAILNATREEKGDGLVLLRAACCGLEVEPYEVRVLLRSGGAVEGTECNCPYDHSGVCKHLVALLLMFATQPDSFHTLTPLEEILDAMSRDDLAVLVREMVAREPQLLATVNQWHWMRIAGEGDEPILSALPDATSLRSRARGVIRGVMQNAINAWQWEYDADDAPRKLVRGLEKILGEVRFTATAAPDIPIEFVSGLYSDAVLHEIVKAYFDELHMLDEEGEITVLAEQCAEELRRCIKILKGNEEYISQCNLWSKTLTATREII